MQKLVQAHARWACTCSSLILVVRQAKGFASDLHVAWASLIQPWAKGSSKPKRTRARDATYIDPVGPGGEGGEYVVAGGSGGFAAGLHVDKRLLVGYIDASQLDSTNL